jgi:uncharacterized OsmC-like protein
MADRMSPPGQSLGVAEQPGHDSSGAPKTLRSGVIRTLHCRTQATSRFRHRHQIRDLPPFGDGHEDDGSGLLGDDTMPNPSEALLAALGSCLLIGIQANAVSRAIPIRRLAIDLRADTSFAAHWGTGEPDLASIGFEAIKIEVHIEADVPREVLKALLDHALLWSPIANTLHNPVHLDLALA